MGQSIYHHNPPKDTLFWGESSFKIFEFPLEPLLNVAEEKKGRIFRSKSFNNPRGYTAKWSLTNNRLFLETVKGRLVRKSASVSNELEIEDLPIPAKWFSGEIHLLIGNFDLPKQSYPYCIKLIVDKGDVKSSLVIENYAPFKSKDQID